MKNRLVTSSASASFTWEPPQLQDPGSLCCWSHKADISSFSKLLLLCSLDGQSRGKTKIVATKGERKKSVFELSSVMHSNGLMQSMFKPWTSEKGF